MIKSSNLKKKFYSLINLFEAFQEVYLVVLKLTSPKTELKISELYSIQGALSACF